MAIQIMPEKIKMKIGRASYIQRTDQKDYLKTRSRIESLPMRKLIQMSHMTRRVWKLNQEGNDFFLILEAVSWEEEDKSMRKEDQQES
jgi:hypothetical protein